jgi:4-methylaminobutanoate oxidase (formaldehyde-forming)
MSDSVVVVGCGAVGLSIAHHLALRGARVVAVDRAQPGSQTSSRAAGQSVLVQTERTVGSLMHRSVRKLRTFTADTGVPLPLHRVGSVKLALSDWAVGQVEREVVRARSLGVQVELIDVSELERLAPHLDARGVLAAWHCADDLYFEPPEMLAAFHRAAQQAGVRFEIGAEVLSITHDGDRVTGVQTGAGAIHADAVVIAAGSWTTGLLEGHGVGPIPLCYVRHQYAIRGPVAGIHPGLPSTRIVDHAVYARPSGTNLMFGTYEPVPKLIEPDAIPDRVEDVRLDPDPVAEALHRVASIFPGVPEAPLAEMRGGVVSMTPDRLYVIDEAGGLFFLTGCNVLGLSVSPAVGEDVAEWVTSGHRPDSLAAFGLARFGALPPKDVRRISLEQYERIYRDDEAVGHVRDYGRSS